MKNKIKYLALFLSTTLLFTFSNANAYNYSTYNASYSGSYRTYDLDYEEPEEDLFYDPIEPFNRFMFKVNMKLYKLIASPVLEGYRGVTTPKLRVSIGNFSDNLKQPFFLINRILQLDFSRSGKTIGRFVINTTAGFFGFFDVAREMGMKNEYTDMGLTFAKYGIGSGPFLMIPLYGPTTFRDGVGNLGDFALDPFNFNALNIGDDTSLLTNEERMGRYVINSFVDFERVKDGLDSILETSFDPYANVRSAYYQNRAEKIKQMKKGER